MKDYRTKSIKLKRKVRKPDTLIESNKIISEHQTFLLESVLDEFPELRDINDKMIELVGSFHVVFDITEDTFVGKEITRELHAKFARLTAAVCALNDRLNVINKNNKIIEDYLKGVMKDVGGLDFKWRGEKGPETGEQPH
jgi:hypothetical protein